MFEFRITEGNLQFILPKEGSANVLLPRKDSSVITRIIDIQIEDFLERLNGDLVKNRFIALPRVLIGDREVSVNFCLAWGNSVTVAVSVATVLKSILPDDDAYQCDLRSILLTGHVGNLTFEERGGAAVKKCGSLNVVLGSMEEVEEAMTTSDNHRFDLQVILTASVTKGSNNDHWIIPR